MSTHPSQPEWLKKYAGGLSNGHQYKPYLEGLRFAIVRAPGHTAYVDRMTRNKYAKSQYVLIEKGKAYWDRAHTTLHEGRVNKVLKVIMAQVLADAEKGKPDPLEVLNVWKRATEPEMKS